MEAPDRIGGEPEFSVYEVEAVLGLLDHRVVNYLVPDTFQGVVGQVGRLGEHGVHPLVVL